MRKLLPMAAVLLAAALVVPAPAQFSLSSSNGPPAQLPTTLLPRPAPIDQMLPKYNISQSLPKYNINQMLAAGKTNPRTFNFAKMLPNFSFINNRLPPKLGQLPPSKLGQLQPASSFSNILSPAKK